MTPYWEAALALMIEGFREDMASEAPIPSRLRIPDPAVEAKTRNRSEAARRVWQQRRNEA